MPQETNFNVSPYFDDFDAEKNYYKVLFKPGYPIQARELTTLQSILQNQIEQYGKHIFKEGSLVIPGQLRYESPFYGVEIQPDYNGIPISFYFDLLNGKRIRGESSGVTAEIVYTITNTESERGNYTIYVKYLQSGGQDFANRRFQDNETLLLETSLTYDNFTIQSGQGFCNTIVTNAISEGSSVSVAKGVYFVRGIFANVNDQTIILDQYDSNPSYKVGFNVIEKILTSDEDETLFDNAQGFSNYAAPGADRFNLELELSKRNIDDTNTENFVEILRVVDGTPIFFNKNAQYNLIRDELARRTYDESGDYFVRPFNLTIRDSLNDRVLNDGIFFKNQLTISGNTPSEELMVYQVGSGKAYVNGYDVETISPRLLDVPKTRTTAKAKNSFVNFNAGVPFVVNNVYGSPRIGIGVTSTVRLMNSRVSDPNVASGTEIGSARVYDFVPESAYVDQKSRFNLRLFDIDTYTTIVLTKEITLSTPAVIKGKRSKATGYLRSNVSNSKTLSLYSVSGNFLENEPISINEVDDTRLIVSIIDYSISDIKSIYSQVGISTFSADVVLNANSYIAPPGTTFNINNGVASAGLQNTFINTIKPGDLVSYSVVNYSGDPIINKVSSVSAGGTSFVLSSIPTVSGICNGTIPGGNFDVTNIYKVYATVSSADSSLLTTLNNLNINSVGISESEIIQRRIFSSVAVQNNYSLSISIDPLDIDVYFESFDEDRFVITYSDGSIELMRSDKYFASSDRKTLTFFGLSKNSGTADVIATVVNTAPSSKSKKFNKVSTLIVSNSKFNYSGIGSTTLNDGLTYSNVYGTRVQDEEICLNLPDVIRVLGIYESTSVNDPQIPYLQLTSFSGVSNNNQDYIIGERIVGSSSNAVAIIVSKKDSDKIEYVYLNAFAFEVGESVEGEESKVKSVVVEKYSGDKNITQSYLLDNGQRPYFYDYGRIVRKSKVAEPTKKIKIIFQNYVINSGDTGEFITANSYDVERFKHDVPLFDNIRLTDYIDIRPRVAPYTLSSRSPFEFSERNFASDGQYSKYIIAPDENLSLNYSYYQGRVDLLSLNPDGTFEVIQGIPSDFPIAPTKKENSLDIARIYLPPYIYNVNNVEFEMTEHKRYRMCDIALLEDRIERVEKYTTLSMLESKTENFTIKDAETGLDRFKCGFFVDNFSSHTYHDITNPYFKAAIDTKTNTLRPSHYTTSLDLQLGSEVIPNFTTIYSPDSSHSFPNDLGSLGIKKTGDLITLNYTEVEYFKQRYATKTESVTPFLVRYWLGLIELRPSIDTWIEERVNKTYSSETIEEKLPSLPDENITIIKDEDDDKEVYRDKPSSRCGVKSDSSDWIENARNILSKLKCLGGITIKNLPPTTKSSRPDGIIGANAIIGNTLHLEVLKSRVNQSDLDIINKLLPPDVAKQFITQIKTKNSNARALIQFSQSKSTSSDDERRKLIRTTTKSESNTKTTVILPEITETDGGTIERESGKRSEIVRFLRSRNIEFDIKGLKPVTRFYPFFEGIDVQNYITPKLLEIEMISGRFQVGEIVESSPLFTAEKLRFRVCAPNHKFGPFNNPTEIFQNIPYTQQVPPTSYSETSQFINVDTNALQLPSEIEYYGLAKVGMTITGKISGATARITNIRLVSDNVGRLIGSLFIPDPGIEGNPKWINGQNTFTVIDIPSLDTTKVTEFIPNTTVSESGGDGEFYSSAVRNITDVNVVSLKCIKIRPSRNINTTTITNKKEYEYGVGVGSTSSTKNNVKIWETHDPLAQSFYVTDDTGVFLTSVEVYFQTKDESLPVTLQIRPIAAGVPSNVVVPFSEVTLTPKDVNVSTDGSVPTKFTFPSPVYLNGPIQQEIRQAPIGSRQTSEYSVVLLSGSPNYRVFVAELGQNDILEPNVKLTQQPTLGSLFKSQNGSTWTPSQLEDLKYKLYRANFNAEGLVRFFNPQLSLKNNKITVTGSNQFVPLSKRIIVNLNSSNYNADIKPGISLIQNNSSAKIIGIAGDILVGAGVSITNAGFGYTSGTFTNVNLITETGYGLGAVATIGINSITSEIETVSITNGGFGYTVGDSLIIPEIGSGVGFGGKVTVSSISSNNTFILDEVNSDFNVGIGLSYITSSGITSSIGTGINISGITSDQYYTGTHMKVYQLNHGMHSPENYVEISKFLPETSQSKGRLVSPFESSTMTLTSGTGIGFTQFEGTQVSALNPGYIIIGREIMEYNQVNGDTLTISQRGIDPTLNGALYSIPRYSEGTLVYKYEFNGISLRRINKIHNLSLVDQQIHPTDLNSYHIKIETGNTDYEGNVIGSNRSGNLYFNKTIQGGNSGTNVTNNIQYEVITPIIPNIVLPRTTLSARIRTFTGTSVGGNEKSFIDTGFTPVELNSSYYFDSPRIICSSINESRFITESPGNRSFSIDLLMNTEDSRISPVIDTSQTSIVLTSNLINNPIGVGNDDGYSDDPNVRNLTSDKHSVVYLSKPITLKLPSNSLKVIFSASTTTENDIRVLYQTFRLDSPNLSDSFDLFPGWSNYRVDGQGIKRVIDFSKNNGSSDSKITKSSDPSFKEYEYSVDDLADFDGFTIKIIMASSNQAKPPLIKDLRAIATVKPRV